MDLKETYNRIADDWHKDKRKNTWWMPGTDKFISFLKAGNTVLDVGCGPGLKSKYLGDRGFTVTGIDFSDTLIEIARKEVPDAEFFVLDMRDVQSLPGRFDAVFAQASLLHIPKREAGQVIHGLASKLKPPGYMYIAVKGIWQDGIEEHILKEEDYGYPYERFFSYYSMEELKGYLTDEGLEVIDESSTHVGHTDWLQIIGRRA